MIATDDERQVVDDVVDDHERGAALFAEHRFLLTGTSSGLCR